MNIIIVYLCCDSLHIHILSQTHGHIITHTHSVFISFLFFRMASLLRKFRIKYSDVIEVTGISNRPSKDRSVINNNYMSLSVVFLSDYRIDQYLALPLDEGIDESNLDKKTLRHIRLGELLHEHSSDARLIVM